MPTPGTSSYRLCAWTNCHSLAYQQLPVCARHGAEIAMIYWKDWDGKTPGDMHSKDFDAYKAKLDSIRAAARQKVGQIYYVRLNDVIKIGWTSNLYGRLTDYTPGAILLAHHPGTRADERDLHRSFKPLRVHGREWYTGDAQIILDHIANVLDEHGPPQVELELSGPRGQATHTRHRSKSGSYGA